MKIATWNVNSIRVRLPHIIEWLGMAGPDILALQETKTTDDAFPVEEISAAGYNVVFSGQKTYNGVAILSKSIAQDTVTELPGFTDPQRRVLAATIDGVRIVNLYVPNGSSVDSEKYTYKLEWLNALITFTEQQLAAFPQTILLGDFNIAPEDEDVHDPEAWQGQVLVSEPERAAFSQLLALGLTDTFRLFEHEEQSFSWWDYRAAAFRRNRGLRIDHILSSQALVSACIQCEIDKEPRKWERPSDHAPVLASYALLD